jgi:hypothetical protein
MHARNEKRLSIDRRTNTLLWSARRAPRALPAIDAALLLSFANWFKVPMHVPQMSKVGDREC